MTDKDSAQDKHKIGVIGAISYVVGNVIGSGIFVSPSGILRRTNSIGLSLVIWVMSGAITLLGAFCYLELGTAIRESGADFAYLCFVRWYSVAFAFMWVSVIITYPTSSAIGIMTFALFAAANLFSLNRYATLLQILFTAAKLLAMAIIIVTGFFYLFFRDGSANFNATFSESAYNAGDLTLALYGGLWAYGGYNVLNFGVEELRNPRRTMPLAIFGGIAVITLLYFAINVAYFAVLDKKEMLESQTVAVAQVCDVARDIMLFATKVLGNFAYAYPALIGIVLCGTTNTTIFSSSRYMFAAARRGHLPSCIGLISVDTNSPRVAVIFSSALTMAMMFIGGIEQLINYHVSLSWMQTCVALAALFWIRYKQFQVHQDSFKFHLIIPVLYLLASVMLVVIPIYQRPVETAIGVGLLFSGFVVYFALIKTKRAPYLLKRLNDSTLIACQKLFLGVLQRPAEEARLQKNASTTSCEAQQSATLTKYEKD